MLSGVLILNVFFIRSIIVFTFEEDYSINLG